MDSRRDFLKKALYAAPLVMTVAVRPAFARSGYTGGSGGNAPGGGINISSPPSGTGGHGGGNKDAHDWWMFWRKL